MVWGAAALSSVALTAAGPVSVPVGLGAIATCMAIAIGTLARRQRRVEREADVHRIALAIGRDGVWDYDLRSGSVHYDDRCAQMLGYERGHVADRLSAWGKLVHPDDLAGARSALDDYLDGSADAYEVRVRLRDVRGCWRWIIDRGRVVQRAPDGKPLRVIGIHREVVGAPVDERPATPDPRVTLVDETLSDEGTSPIGTLDAEQTVRAAMGALLVAVDAAEREADPRVESSTVTDLRKRLERLEVWNEPELELVPLAAAVDGFSASNVDVALDLPIAEADATILLEVIALVVAEASGDAMRKIAIEPASAGENRAGIAIVAPRDCVIDTASPRVEMASDLARLTAGEVRAHGSRVEIVLRSPRH